MLPLVHAIRALRQADRQRDGVPGEHWATFAVAYGTLRWASRTRSPLLRSAGYVVGAALVLRAIGGRDGLMARIGPRPQRSPSEWSRKNRIISSVASGPRRSV